MRSGTLLPLVGWLACFSLPGTLLARPVLPSADHLTPLLRSILQSQVELLPVSYANFSDAALLTSLRDFVESSSTDYTETLDLVPLHVSNLRDNTGAEILIPAFVPSSPTASSVDAFLAAPDVDRIKAALVRLKSLHTCLAVATDCVLTHL